MQGQCRIQKRNWFCESGDIPACSSRPKKCKEDLKRYAFTRGYQELFEKITFLENYFIKDKSVGL